MANSVFEELTRVVAAGKRQAAQLREQLGGQNKVSLQARELRGTKFESAVVHYRKLSDVVTIPVRASSVVEVNKRISGRLLILTKSRGLERFFIHWVAAASAVEALVKVHEYRHDFLRRSSAACQEKLL